MKTRILAATLAVAGLASLAAMAPKPAMSSHDQAVAALRAADVAWSKTAEAKSLDGMVAGYTEDAVVLPDGAPRVTGREGIRALLAGFFGAPGFALKWEPLTVEVAASGELGVTSGAYELTLNGPDGKPMLEKGKYLEVWRKQKDGRWLCTRDMFSADAPPPPPAPAPAK